MAPLVHSLAYRAPRTITDWSIFGGIAGFVMLMMILVAAYHYKRRRRIAEAAQALGLAQVQNKSQDAGFVHRPQPRESRLALEVCAVGLIEGRAARLAEYNFATPSGKSHLTHHNLQISLECPEDWPLLRIADVYGIEHKPVEQYLWADPGGAPPRPWAAEQASRLLSPAVRALLAQGSKFEAWDIGNGWLTCTWRKSCSAESVPAILVRVQAAHGALSGAWAGRDAGRAL